MDQKEQVGSHHLDDKSLNSRSGLKSEFRFGTGLDTSCNRENWGKRPMTGPATDLGLKREDQKHSMTTTEIE